MNREMPVFDAAMSAHFWSHVAIGTPLECWHWQLGVDKNGYGKASVGKYTLRAHRVAYYLHYGADPLNLLVCHTCDNPVCCNPHHMFLGNNQQNIQDAADKGRLNPRTGDQHGLRLHPEAVLRGEDQPSAKLTETQVLEIRRLYQDERLTHQQIGDRFGVNRKTIGDILNGKNWKHLIPTGEYASIIDPSRQGRASAKLTKSDVLEIRRLYRDGFETQVRLAKRFNVSSVAISNIVNRVTWKHIK